MAIECLSNEFSSPVGGKAGEETGKVCPEEAALTCDTWLGALAVDWTW
jgi:hypothetical protein